MRGRRRAKHSTKHTHGPPVPSASSPSPPGTWSYVDRSYTRTSSAVDSGWQEFKLLFASIEASPWRAPIGRTDSGLPPSVGQALVRGLRSGRPITKGRFDHNPSLHDSHCCQFRSAPGDRAAPLSRRHQAEAWRDSLEPPSLPTARLSSSTCRHACRRRPRSPPPPPYPLICSSQATP
jgi:hypothetical protein